MKRRILSFLMACFMIASTFIISKPIVDVHAIETGGDKVVVTYEADLSVDKTVNGQFFIAAQRLTGGGLVPVESEATPAYVPEFPGNWIVGWDHSTREPDSSNSDTFRGEVTQKPEAAFSEAQFIMVPVSDGSYRSVVAFEAPADGSFDATAKLVNVWEGDPEMILMKEGGEVYATKRPSSNGEIVTLTAENVELKKGERLLVIVGINTTGTRSAGLVSYVVKGTYSECPHAGLDDGVCDECGESCPHDWSNGVCEDCNASCDHDYSGSSVACKICGVACAHNWSSENGYTSCTLCGSIYVKHEADINIDNTVNGQFSIMAERASDGALLPVESTPTDTWSPEYPGNWVAGLDHNAGRWDVTQILPEGNSSIAKFLMRSTPGDLYRSVVAFEAPAAGYFNATVVLENVYKGYPSAVLMKEDGTVYEFEMFNGSWGDTMTLEAENVKLNKGEKLLVVVGIGARGEDRNVGFVSYVVEGAYLECPHVWEDNICKACGATCNHEWGDNSTCDICGETCGHKNWADGKCTSCGAACAHDYTNKTGYCANCGLPCVHNWVSADKKTSCTLCGVTSERPYIKHTAEVDIYNTIKGNFSIVALRESDGAIVPVDAEPTATWSPAYPGNWIAGWDHSTRGDMTQLYDGGYTEVKFAMLSSADGTHSSAVAFKAPADGVFDATAKIMNLYGGDPSIRLMKQDGTVYQFERNSEGGRTVTLVAKNVELKKGEMLLVVVGIDTTNVNRSAGFVSFEVGGLYDECPHAWVNDGTCEFCDDTCEHVWNGRDKYCTVCGFDRSAELAQDNFNNALDNYFNGGDAAIDATGPVAGSLDRFKVTRPSEKVTGLEYAQFNLRFENGIIIRHHFIVEGDNIDLYTFTVNGVKVTPTKTGAEVYYIETTAEAGKLHVPDTITVKKGNESVDFSVSVYSYIAVALEKSNDANLINVLKSLYDLNEALYAASGDRNLLEITVDSENISKFMTSRPYDKEKDDITLILVVGQSNFTRMAGYAWEYNHYYNLSISPVAPVSPIIPAAGTAYSFVVGATSFELNDASDMFNLSSPDRGLNCYGGVTPSFAAKWNELTKTKVVFVQAAVESTGIHEWTPNPDDYDCNCTNYGGGVCYSNAVTTYKNAYAALAEDYNIVYSGYIWNQGEHDEPERNGATVCDPQSYYGAYKSMHDGFMNELDLDFGGISVVRADRAGDTKEASASYTKARYAQYKLCNDIDNLYMLSTISETCTREMMDQGNTVHYSQAVFNNMGTDMANNLYSYLGLGTTNAYDGIKLLNKSGYIITHIDANGELVLGKNVITAKNTDGRILIKTSALGRDDTVSYKITLGGIDYSQYIDGFGLIDWEGLKADLGVESLKVVVNVK